MASGFSSLAITGVSLPARAMACFGGADVRGGAHETESEIIGADHQGRLQIFAVFRGHRRNIEFDSGKIDAFVLAEVSADFRLE